jgi:membrane fusion protein (multidrug efflux system)
VRIHVELPREDAVIALPQTALVTSLYGDYVYAARPKEGENAEGEKALEARQVFVQVGRRSGTDVEIVSGLTEGDVVVTAGQNRLSNGTPLAIDNTLDPATGLKREAAAQ